LDNWRRTSEGKKFYRASGIKLGTRYGALYGGDRAFATKHEILLADRLNGWSIPYEWNSKVFKTGRRGGYKIDFYFPQYKVAVEIDGKHHKTARMVLHDTKRDRFLLRKYGVRTVRVRNEDVKSLTKSGLIRRISVITNI
jgi:very-short-patch-repair endonuclease